MVCVWSLHFLHEDYVTIEGLFCSRMFYLIEQQECRLKLANKIKVDYKKEKW